MKTIRLTFCILGIGVGVVGLSGCFSQDPSANSTQPSVARGRTLYQTQCIACHHSDPHKPGTLGPDVFGSSKELLEARILRGDYPAGYQAKRQTRLMAPLPHLKDEVESIRLFLNEP